METRQLPLPFASRASMLPADALFWYAEEVAPQVRPQIAGLLVMDRSPDRQCFRTSVKQLVACLPRLRQRVMESPLRLSWPEWQDDSSFDLDYHLRTVALPRPGTHRQLLEFASAAFADPFDRFRPLWKAYLIEGLEGHRAACLFKLHHSIIDGVGSVSFFEALTQPQRDDVARGPQRRPITCHPRPGSVAPQAGWGAAFETAVRIAANPVGTARQFVKAAGSLSSMISEFTGKADKDPLAADCTGLGRRLEVVSLSMPRMQRIKEALGVTLNDLVLAAVAGAVGRYHDHCRVHVEELQCVVPMNLRQAGRRDEPGNRLGIFFVTLPVGERDPLVRLRMIRQQTTTAKGDGRGSSLPVLMEALRFIPGRVLRALADSVNGRIGLICTNVPGPSAQRYLAGAKIEAIYPFVSVMFGMPLTIALLSYGDSYAVGIATDPTAISLPRLLHRYVEEAVEEIEHRTFPAHAERARPRWARRAVGLDASTEPKAPTDTSPVANPIFHGATAA